jgi:transcriptional regulator with XRE-family HTH domain
VAADDSVSGVGRNCAGCGKPLSRYNSGTRCQSCQRGQEARTPATGKSAALIDGAKLAQLRRETGWTQQMLADRAGLGIEIVRKLEQGAKSSARLSTLTALAGVLNVPAGILLGESGVSSPTDVRARQAPSPDRADRHTTAGQPTLLRVLITQRHWQRFRTFETQFRRAAQELADREGDKDLGKLTVSSRQWERWYSGNIKREPHPDACRVLEHMFGYPVQQLLAPSPLQAPQREQDRQGPAHAGVGMRPTRR